MPKDKKVIENTSKKDNNGNVIFNIKIVRESVDEENVTIQRKELALANLKNKKAEYEKEIAELESEIQYMKNKL